MNTEKILKKYKTIPKYNLLNHITPLQNLDKIAKQFDLQNLYVKRDDLTNFLGGEEVRFYEYILPFIKSKNYNSILNVNDYHSNDGIVASMISKKNDLDYFLITKNAAHKHSSGNILISKLFSNEVHSLDEFWSSNIDDYIKRVISDLKKNNFNPILIHKNEEIIFLKSLAYINAAMELNAQFETKKIKKPYILCTLNESFLGLLLASKLFNYDWKFIGIQIESNINLEKMMEIIETKSKELFNIDIIFSSKDLEEKYDVSNDYGVLSEKNKQAILLASEKENILLNPLNDCKILSYVIENTKKLSDKNLIIINTGTNVSIYNYLQNLNL
jgi:1-aminocyclopropane-1-carboxylate deaminase/D-cysteine desulfhydrase-like pyridoxal-dependent ACC family enzyme